MKTLIVVGAAGLVAAFGLATAAAAFQGAAQSQSTPKGWNYEIKDGKRVPKGTRQVNPDGSWREEIRNGKCVTIKQKSADGVYKETCRCD